MANQPLSQAFVVAFEGIRIFFRNDRNGRIHGLAAMAVLLAGIFLQISAAEWCLLLLCVAIVLSAEMFNHAIEKLCDALHPQQHPLIKICKDVAAGAVLVTALLSAAIGLLIFIPKLFLR